MEEVDLACESHLLLHVRSRCRLSGMSHSPCITVVCLGSGSAGNCTAVDADGSLLLVDCGFSARETAARLTQAGFDPSRVSGILVTHEHGDHIRGIDVFRRRYAPGCIVYATAATLSAAALGGGADSRTVVAGRTFEVGGARVAAFRTSHDAADPVGYRIEAGEDAFGIATDCGIVTAEVADGLAGCTVLGLEFNHDVDMLERGPYPHHLKRRILSARGHLSNADAAAALEKLAHGRLARVIALHRSRTNNTATLAQDALSGTLRRLDHPAAVEVAPQERCSPNGSAD